MLSQEEFDFIKKNLKEDPRSLALRTHGKFKDSMGFLLTQIKLKQKAKKKLPIWATNHKLLFPSSLSYEQCSSQVTANYKASLFSGESLLDISGGIGIDALAFAESFTNVTHVEYNSDVQKYCEFNFTTLNKTNITSICDNGLELLSKTEQKWDLIYVDPDRRPDTTRTNELQDCLPDVTQNLDLFFSKADKVLIKASPMCDINLSIKQLKNVAEIHVVSHKNECKEVLFLLDKKKTGTIAIKANELETDFFDSYSYKSENTRKPKSSIKEYIYDPFVSFRKARLTHYLSEEFKLNPISDEGTLLTGEHFKEKFPGRIFQVTNSVELDRKKVAKLGIKKANVISRGFYLKADEIVKKLNLKDGGEIYLISYLDKGNKAFLAQCTRI